MLYFQDVLGIFGARQRWRRLADVGDGKISKYTAQIRRESKTAGFRKTFRLRVEGYLHGWALIFGLFLAYLGLANVGEGWRRQISQ